MDAMILAAGHGVRMMPLTASTPKPLLRAGRLRLIEYHLYALAAAGHGHVVINTGKNGQKISDALGDGADYGVRIEYSHEGDEPLETGGGIKQALSVIESDPFIAVNADIWTDFSFAGLPGQLDGLAHLVLVDNPPHNENGDFTLTGSGIALPVAGGTPALTFSGVSVLRKQLFDGMEKRVFSLVEPLADAIRAARVSGERYGGVWRDIGSPDRLAALDAELRLAGDAGKEGRPERN